jgi:predicted unusual protein kinase regulating ubiquinone biosynthesis (AarF/ABC1/UbiB family)
MASLGLRTGASFLGVGDGTRVAAEAMKTLGTMRGLATKVGQMASYVDGVVPASHREAFEAAMSTLRANAPQSSPKDVRDTILRELGHPVEALFAEWDDVPIASASIGQVHRARMHDGRDVVVKVQHPGIAEAMASDLDNLGMLEAFGAAFGGRHFKSDEYLDIVRSRFTEELDYTLEAERMDLFRRAHRGDPDIIIPAVIHELSSERVLTSELIVGMPFGDAVKASEELRRKWTITLWRFVARGLLESGLLNGDPHPGNYIFLDDGRVAFLDFGCCEVLPEHQVAAMRRVHDAAATNDEAAFRREFIQISGAKPGRLGDAVVKLARDCFEYLFSSPFRFTREYVEGLVRDAQIIGVIGATAPRHEQFAGPPELLFIHRLQFGFSSILARLDVEVDFREQTRAHFRLVA